jgi:hypothetical protein
MNINRVETLALVALLAERLLDEEDDLCHKVRRL